MRLQKVVWMVVLVGCSAGFASAQGKSSVVRYSVTLSNASTSGNGFSSSSPWTQSREMNASLKRSLGPVKYEVHRNAFLSQTRVPLATFWGGRVQFACVHQRVRGLHVHSGVVLPDAASSLRVAQPGLIPARSSNSYGGGLWLQLGRRKA